MPELVALDLPGGTGFVDTLRAVWDTGDAAAPLDPRLPDTARRALLAALRPTRVVGSDGAFHRIGDGLPVEEGDALVVATSGSSGAPRGVVLTHHALAASARATSERLGVDPDRHAWLCCLPLSHVGGLSVVTRALLTGTPLRVLPGFDADAVQRLGRSGEVTHVSLVATGLRRIDAGAFTCVLLGGSRPPETLAPNVVVTYGLTETGSGVLYDGVPLDGVEVALAHFGDGDGDGDGDGYGDGDGEVLLRAPMLMRCYRDGDDGRVVGPDGTRTWFATGDAGYLTDKGAIAVRGRVAEVIVTGGEKVWPDAVERVLSTHAGVAEVAVWKRPDPEWGERVVAWVVPGTEGSAEGSPAVTPTAQELADLVRATLSPWAAPKEVVYVTELPRTPSGKVRRSALA
ncbi:MAG: class I adenylate-forming enzyme family protein [Acidimicrobiales bacterium]